MDIDSQQMHKFIEDGLQPSEKAGVNNMNNDCLLVRFCRKKFICIITLLLFGIFAFDIIGTGLQALEEGDVMKIFETLKNMSKT